MYNKLFGKILDSSIWLEDIATRIVWLTLLAAMDQDGYAHFSAVGNLATRARVTLEQAQKAVDILSGPDPDSHDPDNEGRRIERVPGGFMVLNAEKYRKIVKAEEQRRLTRERVSRHRQLKHKPNTECNADVTPCNDSVTQSNAEANANTELKNKNRTADGAACGGFAEIRSAYPSREGGQRWADAEKAYKARIREGNTPADILAGVKRYAAYCQVTGITSGRMVQQAATFLGPNKGFLESWEAKPATARRNQAQPENFTSKTYTGTPLNELSFVGGAP